MDRWPHDSGNKVERVNGRKGNEVLESAWLRRIELLEEITRL